jgi:Rps23 Pro-64 3,4-dihydroxylase Tpa1-like proline 4-hydroxylase
MDKEYNSSVKLDTNYLTNINNQPDILNYFGNWVHNIHSLRDDYKNALPFEHIVIDDFLNQEYAETLYKAFPDNHENWHVYNNPIEVKFTFDDINSLDTPLKNYFYYLSTNILTDLFRQITDIHDLCHDEYLHGAGLHSHPRYGRLNMHLDYEKHPHTGKERRLNVIYFLSKNWEPSWNGQNQLWDSNMTQCVTKTDVKFNRAIIFKTNDVSWHGLPDKILCPPNIYRKTLAFYYVSPMTKIKQEKDYRFKAKFVKRPQDTYDSNLEELYKIRPNRRITSEDLQKYMPYWTNNN